MRTQIALQALLAASLFGSTIPAVAQTGEVGYPTPGRVVHDGWSLQDYLQNLRNGTPAQSPDPPPATPNYYSDPNSAKPAVGRKSTGNGTKDER